MMGEVFAYICFTIFGILIVIGWATNVFEFFSGFKSDRGKLKSSVPVDLSRLSANEKRSAVNSLFTLPEKQAVLWAILYFANIEGLTERDRALFHKLREELGFIYTNALLDKIKNSKNDEFLSILKNMTRYKKDLFILYSYQMIFQKDFHQEASLNSVATIFENSGIKLDRIPAVLTLGKPLPDPSLSL